MGRSKRTNSRPRIEDLQAAIEKLQLDILPLRDLELVVIKSHLLVEILLRVLLGIRLDIPIEQLPSLQFQPLALLALGGAGRRELKKDVLRLNELRNDFAHEVLPTEYSKDMWAFVGRWRRSRGSARIRWVNAGKLRFIRTSLELLIHIVAEIRDRVSIEDASRAFQPLSPNIRVFWENPSLTWKDLQVDTDSFRELPDLTLQFEIRSAERALLEAVKIRNAAMTSLQQKRSAGQCSDVVWEEASRNSDNAGDAANRLFEMMKVWRSARIAQDFEKEYHRLSEAICRLRAAAETT